ncbi:invasion protein CiaB [Arcobacter sp. FWKO B]|uniref:invasion protein CiaB n=1 Tax=Arcobacter sp. FWKO B TaxID=2593672 RepID=UPI0018A5A64E|nr:invasion protein CiaB [Arcobacter sp. FWKO B]QOG13144.1 invasion protein CiaB [Arcobacter sp. FWKO B]
MEKFKTDLHTLYNFLDKEKDEKSKLYHHLENDEHHHLQIIDEFANFLELDEINNDIKLALITRLISLRSDSLVQVLKKRELDQKTIEMIDLKGYEFVKDYWHKEHRKTVDFIKSNDLFTPFYRAIFEGVYNIGVAFSSWQPVWTQTIIHQINAQLLEKFEGDNQKVHKFLEENNLFDLGHNGEIADRSYSILHHTNGEYKSIAYIKAFKKEVTYVIDLMEDLIDTLIELEDNLYNHKWDYILYFQAIVQALSEDKTDTLVSKWADVDRAWMKIKTPIQIGHPLEYYEDHFRKAVALEWDIRLSNPNSLENKRAQITKNAFINLYNSLDIKNENIYNLTISSIDKTMLFIGRPAMNFGAGLNGMFSAQVVPNDEVVSNEFGKKIFAFSDEILQSARAKPFLKLHKEIFGDEFLKAERVVLFSKPDIWHKVYDISTIGHEFGHILWCDVDSESIMNRTGHFKNIEEFKATTGGIVSFLLNDEESYLTDYVIHDIIKRAITLIAWQEVGEVLPYYCEGLIHLKGLFESDILSFDTSTNKLTISQNPQTIEKLKNWYLGTYKELAICYMNKSDAWEFLKNYVKRDKEIYLPIEANIEAFVRYYYKRYQEIGQEIDYTDKKSNYII